MTLARTSGLTDAEVAGRVAEGKSNASIAERSADMLTVFRRRGADF